MSAPLILHHHDPSPFAEKIRKVFGIKGLAWQSVQIPMSMPKPDLTALTGGYRGTPVLQIGADIYCDSRRIIAELEKRFPEPGLFGAGPLVNFGLQHWSDDIVFPPGASLSLFENAVHIPADVSHDRKGYFTNLNFDRFAQDAPHFRSQFQAHGVLLDRQLRDGRAFVLGDTPQWADIGAWLNIWMAGGNIPSAGRLFNGLVHLAAWRARMDAFGTGTRTDIEPQAAHAIARDHTPSMPDNKPAFDDESGNRVGAQVTVTPVDHPDLPVAGQLAHICPDAITLWREPSSLGKLAVHFPRIGYRVEAA